MTREEIVAKYREELAGKSSDEIAELVADALLAMMAEQYQKELQAQVSTIAARAAYEGLKQQFEPAKESNGDAE